MRVISYLNLLQDYNYTHYAADAIVIGTTQILIQFLIYLLKRMTCIEMITEKQKIAIQKFFQKDWDQHSIYINTMLLI